MADSSGSRRLVFTGSSTGKARLDSRGAPLGQVVETKKYSTTMAVSTLRNLLSDRALRTGYGIEDLRVRAIESRRRERVFGAGGPGRSKAPRAVKPEKVGDEYDPRTDTAMRAFVRLLAEYLREEDGSAA